MVGVYGRQRLERKLRRRVDRDGVAEAAGVERAFVARLVEAGILTPADAGEFTLGDVRRVALVDALERGGLPVEVIAGAIRQGRLTLDFVDQPGYGFLATLQPTTFRDVSAETGIPLELLLVVREAMGFAQADPDDRMRSQEAEVVTLLRLLVDHGVRPPIIERLLRVSADSLRRIAETESDLWRTDLLEPLFAAGKSADEIGRITNDIAAEYAVASDRSLLAIAHGQGAHTWLRNIFEGFERTLIDAGTLRCASRPTGDLLSRRHGIHAPDGGARRRRRGRSGGTARSDRSAHLGRPRRQGRQVARGRRDVLLPRAG